VEKGKDMVTKAVIIAAGRGSRLKGKYADVPKPLVPVAGVGLLKRTILTAKRAGITDFAIVTGYRAEEIRAAIESDSQIDVQIDWVLNEGWEQGNGKSVLAARESVGDDAFVLMMSDHLIDAQIITGLRTANLAKDECALAVDSRIDRIFDEDDATKVLVESDRIEAIGKTIDEHNAIDTGVFLCNSTLFTALEEAIATGDDSLSGGIRSLAGEGRMRAHDIGDLFWEDVDTPESLVHAQRALIRSLGKPTDGFVSRHFNRKISTRLSSLLVKTPLTPNQLSISTMFICFIAAWFVAQPDYLSLAIAGVIFQFASIVDGCDGEVAKLKFLGSQFGEWVDTVADNISYLVFFSAFVYGHFHFTGDPMVLTLAWVALGGMMTAVSLIYLYLRMSGSGSIVSFAQAFSNEVPEEKRGWFHRFSERIKFASRRDYFAAMFCVLAVLNARWTIFWIYQLGAMVISAAILFFVGHMMRSRGFWPSSTASIHEQGKLVSEKAD
jgi:1L-myo-inositol 1-phosphate cytidylyltransferase / CDP-L-myo-inositol myo-inositolphosphotransferase